eukprot:gene765-1052_t
MDDVDRPQIEEIDNPGISARRRSLSQGANPLLLNVDSENDRWRRPSGSRNRERAPERAENRNHSLNFDVFPSSPRRNSYSKLDRGRDEIRDTGSPYRAQIKSQEPVGSPNQRSKSYHEDAEFNRDRRDSQGTIFRTFLDRLANVENITDVINSTATKLSRAKVVDTDENNSSNFQPPDRDSTSKTHSSLHSSNVSGPKVGAFPKLPPPISTPKFGAENYASKLAKLHRPANADFHTRPQTAVVACSDINNLGNRKASPPKISKISEARRRYNNRGGPAGPSWSGLRPISAVKKSPKKVPVRPTAVPAMRTTNRPQTARILRPVNNKNSRSRSNSSPSKKRNKICVKNTGNSKDNSGKGQPGGKNVNIKKPIKILPSGAEEGDGVCAAWAKERANWMRQKQDLFQRLSERDLTIKSMRNTIKSSQIEVAELKASLEPLVKLRKQFDVLTARVYKEVEKNKIQSELISDLKEDLEQYHAQDFMKSCITCAEPCCQVLKRIEKLGFNTEATRHLGHEWAGMIFGQVSRSIRDCDISYKDLFKKHQVDSRQEDGRTTHLTQDSFKAIIRQFLPKLTEDRLTRLFIFADKDCSGCFDFSEFMQIFGCDENGEISTEYFEYVVQKIAKVLRPNGGLKKVYSLTENCNESKLDSNQFRSFI